MDDYASVVVVHAVGGTLSLALTLTLTCVFALTPALKKDHSSRLLQIITTIDLFYTLKYTIGAMAWYSGWSDTHRSLNLLEDKCLLSTVWGQATGMASITANAAYIIDFIQGVRKPLRGVQGSGLLKMYLVVVAVLVLGAVIDASATFEPAAASATCWTRPHTVYFETILSAVLILAMLSFFYVALMLYRDGAFRTLRMALVRRHSVFILAFVAMWAWPLIHRALDPNSLSRPLGVIDAINACTQAGVLATVRLSEQTVRARLLWCLRACAKAVWRLAAWAASGYRDAPKDDRQEGMAIPLLSLQSPNSEPKSTASTGFRVDDDVAFDPDASGSPRAATGSTLPASTVVASEPDALSIRVVPEGEQELATLTAQLRHELVACLLSGICQAICSAEAASSAVDGFSDRFDTTAASGADALDSPAPATLSSPALARSHVGAAKAKLRTNATILHRMMKREGSELRTIQTLSGGTSTDSLSHDGLSVAVDDLPRPRAARSSMGGYELASYQDAHFRALRQRFGASPAAVIDRFDPALMRDGTITVRFSDGASSSFFCRSSDGLLFVKTVELHEVNTLVSVLPEYSKVLSDRSVLCRLLGCFSLKLPSFPRVYAVLMQNVHAVLRPELVLTAFFPGPLRSAVFDLKGSVQKRSAKARGGKGGLLLDNDFMHEFPLGLKLLCAVSPADAGLQGAALMEAVVNQIDTDISVLTAANIMDYSLMLSVTSLNTPYDPASDIAGVRDAADRVWWLAARGGGLDARADASPLSLLIAAVPRERPAATSDEPCDYTLVLLQLGIIDLLQEYDLKKRMENQLKVIRMSLSPGGLVRNAAHIAAQPELAGARDAGLSAIDAVRYRLRFLEFVRHIFHA